MIDVYYLTITATDGKVDFQLYFLYKVHRARIIEDILHDTITRLTKNANKCVIENMLIKLTVDANMETSA